MTRRLVSGHESFETAVRTSNEGEVVLDFRLPATPDDMSFPNDMSSSFVFESVEHAEQFANDILTMTEHVRR